MDSNSAGARRRQQRTRPPPSPLSQTVLICNFNRNCSIIEKSKPEMVFDDLVDYLTRFGGCLVKQLREEKFLPEPFRMDDIIEVGGADLRLSDGTRFLPETQIRFLGSYFPAIVVKIASAKRYNKVLAETRRALLSMHGRVRIAIVIKIEKASPRPAGSSTTQGIGATTENAAPSGDERLSENDRITVKVFHLTHMRESVMMFIGQEEEIFPQTTDKTFEFGWEDISPDPWPSTIPLPQINHSLRPLSELAKSYSNNGMVESKRPRTLDHVCLDGLKLFETDLGRGGHAGSSQ